MPSIVSTKGSRVDIESSADSTTTRENNLAIRYSLPFRTTSSDESLTPDSTASAPIPIPTGLPLSQQSQSRQYRSLSTEQAHSTQTSSLAQFNDHRVSENALNLRDQQHLVTASASTLPAPIVEIISKKPLRPKARASGDLNDKFHSVRS